MTRTRGLAKILTAAIGKQVRVEAEEIRDPIYASEGFSAGLFKWARYDYDFAVDGGVAGAINLRGGTIPAGAIILGGLLDIETDVASGADAAGCKLSVEAAADVVIHAHTNAAPWDGTGLKAIVPVFTVASAIKTTVARSVAFLIEHANLTGGKFALYLAYLKVA